MVSRSVAALRREARIKGCVSADDVVQGLENEWEEGESKDDEGGGGGGGMAEDAKDGSITSDSRTSPPPDSPAPEEPADIEERSQSPPELNVAGPVPVSTPTGSSSTTTVTPVAVTIIQPQDPLPASLEPMDTTTSEPPEQRIEHSVSEEEGEVDPGGSVTKSSPNISAKSATDDAPLDFSLKKPSTPVSSMRGGESCDDEPSSPPSENGLDGPLDLSVPRRKHHHASSGCPRPPKVGRVEPNLPMPSSPWGYCSPRMPPSATPGRLPESPLWNGRVKRERTTSSSGTESSVGSSPVPKGPSEKISKPETSSTFRPTNRQNPWQSQWISRSGEQTKDVFTCVWCKESFQSLAEMTVHMKQSPRCGMAGMHAATVPPASASASSSTSSGPNTTTPPPPKLAPTPPGSSGATTKDGVPLPRKLVRGQDVWLGKGAEQTRQILKCMWCGQSFKSLADMTTHMRVTQHYTNIISQEQIISWRTPEDKVANQSQVNAVLTCKVCDQAFGSLKELSYHMVKNSHYKEHILRSITEGGGRRRQTRERRKKSLPVRKLLELERMEITRAHTSTHSNQQSSPVGPADMPAAADGKITCEECTEKVDAKDFVQHIKNCSRSQQLLKTALQASRSESSSSLTNGPRSESRKSAEDDSERPRSTQSAGEPDRAASVGCGDSNSETPASTASTTTAATSESTTSVLNAIEKLIEKSFDSKGKRGGPSTTGILQRLGIDEEVYPPWHPAGSPKFVNAVKSAGHSPLPMSVSRSAGGMASPCPSLPDDHSCAPTLQATSRGSTPSRYQGGSSPDRHSSVSAPSPSHHGDSNHGKDPHSEPPVLDPEGVCQPSPSGSSTRMSSPCPEQGNLVIVDGEAQHNSSRIQLRSRSPDQDTDDMSSSSSCGDAMHGRLSAAASHRASSASPSPKPQDLATRRPGTASPRPSSRSPRPSKGENHRLSDKTAGENSADPSSDHPLKELQKLLDKTDAHLSRSTLQASPGGSILAFSWACNDAATSDSLMKCAFCDTHFISKGAYRHHLSKMHFIKDGALAGDSPTWKGGSSSGAPAASNSSGSAGASGTTTANSSKSNSESNNNNNNNGNSSNNSTTNAPASSPTPPADESPHSKFLKYTELAKQLSSKYV